MRFHTSPGPEAPRPVWNSACRRGSSPLRDYREQSSRVRHQTEGIEILRHRIERPSRSHQSSAPDVSLRLDWWWTRKTPARHGKAGSLPRRLHRSGAGSRLNDLTRRSPEESVRWLPKGKLSASMAIVRNGALTDEAPPLPVTAHPALASVKVWTTIDGSDDHYVAFLSRLFEYEQALPCVQVLISNNACGQAMALPVACSSVALVVERQRSIHTKFVLGLRNLCDGGASIRVREDRSGNTRAPTRGGDQAGECSERDPHPPIPFASR